MRQHIDLLRGAGLASGGVAIQRRHLSRAKQHHAFHHLAHLGRSHGGDHAMGTGG